MLELLHEKFLFGLDKTSKGAAGHQFDMPGLGCQWLINNIFLFGNPFKKKLFKMNPFTDYQMLMHETLSKFL